MLVADHVVGVAVVPLNVTVLVPCVAPKFVRVIVTAVPTGPLDRRQARERRRSRRIVDDLGGVRAN